MAPETANQKRKRGRPTAASRDNQEPGDDQDTTRGGETVTQKDSGDVDTTSQPQQPRKRGRPSMALTNTEQAMPKSQSEPQQSSKRKRGTEEETATGNQSKRQQTQSNTATKPDAQLPAKRKRGQASVTKDAGDEASADRAETSPQQSKRKGRRPNTDHSRSKKGAETAAEEADDETEQNSSILRRSPRDRRNKDGSPQSLAAMPKKGHDKAKKKKGKEKAEDSARAQPAEVDQEQTRSQPKQKRGRASARRKTEDREAEEQQADNESPKQPKRRGRHGVPKDSATEVKGGKSRAKPGDDQEVRTTSSPKGVRKERQAPQPADSRRDEAEEAEAEAEAEANEEEAEESSSSAGSSVPRKQPPHRHLLAQRTRRVPLATIEDKWSPLDDASIASVTNLLHSASRPVLHRLSNLQRHALATQALNAASNRVRSKLSRGLPFPAATNTTTSASSSRLEGYSPRIEDLEFERTVSRVEALQAQLEPLLHGVSVLRRERDRAERQLAKDHRFLNHLSGNARVAMRERREQEKKMHVLVPDSMTSLAANPPRIMVDREDVDSDGNGLSNGGGDVAGLADKLVMGSLFGSSGGGVEDGGGEELKILATQLGSHMESMRGNLGQIDGVTPAIEKGRAALRAALLPHLGREGLERVILG